MNILTASRRLDLAAANRHDGDMDLDTLVHRYFGAGDLAAVDAGTLAGGMERLAIDFGLERDRGRRFALWALMHMLGAAPDVDAAFKERADRDAAREFMNLADRAEAG